MLPKSPQLMPDLATWPFLNSLWLTEKIQKRWQVVVCYMSYVDALTQSPNFELTAFSNAIGNSKITDNKSPSIYNCVVVLEFSFR